jgi:hypothetical protein
MSWSQKIDSDGCTGNWTYEDIKLKAAVQGSAAG